MSYNAKTDWKYDDTPTEDDFNRIEKGIKDTTDTVVSHLADDVVHISPDERTKWNATEMNLNTLRKRKSDKDIYGTYTTVEYIRPDGTLYAKSVLSGGTSPQYTTNTITYYKLDGKTVLSTDTIPLTYDSDGDLQSEV
ncbi:hypothetical protein [Bacillus sp. FJAT-49736]|uniref:hypothetical protein n=1 Tax=Bacillus sp. FJAT-49736 TaxID=2833582 RepID=UPI001BC9EA0C|nr:hypothetical protein [Bacillus sp. FJAT-49736]MBS4172134.1 hypothetical protein [Bacillus sp. FJAT-49736]